MARPPGTSFLGAEPTAITAWIGIYQDNLTPVIIDSGADITLISDKTLKKLSHKPPVKTGYTLDLVEVTGETTISGYVTLPIFVDTHLGPVEMSVEAYVVNNMTTPFLLGNDFADQYSTNSIGPSLVKEGGHCFTVNRHRSVPDKKNSQREKKRLKKKRAKENKQRLAVKAAKTVVILPHQCVKVPVTANFPTKVTSLYVEKLFNINKNPDDVYGAPDSLISQSDPFLHVSNFSTQPIKIFPGQTLGIAHNPRNWLD
ncbi:hypothetical protein SCHPADRAFT_840651, partial [Schizopora paradoxa]